MKFSTGLAIVLATGLLAATPVMAQSTTDAKKSDMSNPKNSTKKPTSGMPVGSAPQKYGQPEKQKSSGMPVGSEPQKYGTAEKQKTSGLPVGSEPQRYGTESKNQ